MQIPTIDKIEIPALATHLMYSTNRVAIVATVDALGDFLRMRGRLQFGTYNVNYDRFTPMCGDNAALADGTVVMPFEHRTMKSFAPVRKLPMPPKPHTSVFVPPDPVPTVRKLPKPPSFLK